MRMEMSVSHWIWNSNYMRGFFTAMHGYGSTLPPQTDSLALWCDFASIKMQDLTVALNDADEPLQSVPQNSTLAQTGLVEANSTTTDIIAGGHQIHMQNMQKSTATALGVPTNVFENYRMQFAEGARTLPGFFDFINKAAIIDQTGQASEIDTTASYRTAGNYMQVFICYPYFATNTIEHDPALGIDTSAQIVSENIPVPLVLALITVIFAATAIKSSGTLREKLEKKIKRFS